MQPESLVLGLESIVHGEAADVALHRIKGRVLDDQLPAQIEEGQVLSSHADVAGESIFQTDAKGLSDLGPTLSRAT